MLSVLFWETLSWCLPPSLKYREGDFFPKNDFHGGTNFAGKIYRGMALHGGLMIRSYQEGRSFTKCIFQKSEHCKSEKFSQPW